jgi:hypothetical protein
MKSSSRRKGFSDRYALIARASAGIVLVLVGLSPDLQKITGLEILQCRETPDWVKGKTPEFREQYKK